MTFLQMQTEVFTRLDESSTSPSYWALADVKAALNDGFEELSDTSEWYERSAAINLTANAQYYDLTSASILTDTILQPKAFFNVQTNRWMPWVDVRWLDMRVYPRWGANTGQPERAFIRGLYQFGTYPKAPATSGTITAYYSALPTPLSADGDTVAFPQEFHFGIVEYALYDLLSQDGEVTLAMRHWQAYKQHEVNLVMWVMGRISLDRQARLAG